MTAQSSTNNRFLQYYLYRLGRLKYLMILLGFFSLLTFPLYSVLVERYAYATINYEELESGTYETFRNLCTDLGWKIFLVGAACCLLVMVLILLEGFRYLHRKKYVNMDMVLPVTHTQRFFGDLLAVLTAQFVPILAACGIGEAVVLHVRSIDFSEFWGPDVIPQPIKYCDRIDSTILLFIVVALMLLFMSLFVISFCGRTPIAFMMIAFVQVTVPVITFVLWFLAVGNSYGASDSVAVGDMTLFTLLSPFGYVMAVGYGDMHSLMNRTPWGYLFITVYLAALCAGAYFVQKHRRNERTGEPFVYKYARHGFTALYIMAATAFFALRILSPQLAEYFSLYRLFGGYGVTYDTSVFVVLWLLTSLIILIVAEILGGGKLKELPFTALRFVVTAGLCFGICAGAMFTEGFGYWKYIPSSTEADSVVIDFVNYGDCMSFTVPYDEAVKLHERILEERPYPEYNRLSKRIDGPHVAINYKSGGSNISYRDYMVDDSYIDSLYALYFKYGFKEKYVREKNYEYTYLTSEYRWEKYELNANGEFAFIYKNGGTRQDIIQSDVDIDELFAAMQADAAEVTFDDIYLTPYRSPEYLYIRFTTEYPKDPASGISAAGYDEQSFPVYPFFTRTVTLMREHGIDLFPEAEYSGDLAFIVKATVIQKLGSTLTLQSASYDFRDMLFNTQETAMHRLSADSPEFVELMEYTAEKSYYNEDERYYLVVYRRSNATDYSFYPITESNTARAAEIWSAAPYADTETANLRGGANIYGERE